MKIHISKIGKMQLTTKVCNKKVLMRNVCKFCMKLAKFPQTLINHSETIICILMIFCYVFVNETTCLVDWSFKLQIYFILFICFKFKDLKFLKIKFKIFHFFILNLKFLIFIAYFCAQFIFTNFVWNSQSFRQTLIFVKL